MAKHWVRAIPPDDIPISSAPVPADYRAAIQCPVRGAPLGCGCKSNRLCGVTLDFVILEQCRICDHRPSVIEP